MRHTVFSILTAAAAVVLAPTALRADDCIGYGIVNVSAASLRNEPRHASELETQVLYGTPVEILSDSLPDWRLCRVPDGYKAYIHRTAFAPKNADEMRAWRSAPRVIVTAPGESYVVADTLPASPKRNNVTDITFMAILEGSIAPGSNYACVTLPDGRIGYLPASSVADFNEWSCRDPDIETIEDAAFSMMGVPYLWGGSSPKAVDCSGFTQLCYLSGGLLLPRNASAQAACGLALDPDSIETLNRGDLLFFGEVGSTRISHVAIYLGENRYIHSSGRVYMASFDPDDTLYLPRKALKAVRILDQPDNRIVPMREHPWYFNR